MYDRNDVRNVLSLVAIVAIALWSANEGYKAGVRKGERTGKSYYKK